MSNMIIKLKMPENAAFACPTCGKAFTSERGVGSHKKVHMEKKRSHETMELQNEEAAAVEKTLAFSCPVCPKSYASEKALHGHMRKHSNRGWRGMKPPPPVEGAASLALSRGQSAAGGMNDGKDHSNKVFSCDKCKMMFRSYQALGGHRSHGGCAPQPPSINKEPAPAPAPAPAPSSSRVFQFDLNELPVPETDY